MASWDLKYRPLRYQDVLGQEGTIRVLRARLRNKTAFDVSYIFAGGFGRGKTTLARIHARAMLCQSLKDFEPCNECESCVQILENQPGVFTELDAASNGSVQQAREVVDGLQYQVGSKRIYLWDEAHQLSPQAQDTFLRPIEDGALVGMFCSTEPNKIRPAIRSRCDEFIITPPTHDQLVERVTHILKTEKVGFEPSAIDIVIDHHDGHVRDILKGLELLSQFGDITESLTRQHLHLELVSKYYEILIQASTSPSEALKVLDEVMGAVDPQQACTGLMGAAMGCYRHHYGIVQPAAQLDRNRAEKLWELYGDTLLDLTEWLGRVRYSSRQALQHDIIRLMGGIPKS